MYKIAVMGDYDSIYGFAALGLETFPVNSQDEAEKLLTNLAREIMQLFILQRLWRSRSAVKSKSIKKVFCLQLF